MNHTQHLSTEKLEHQSVEQVLPFRFQVALPAKHPLNAGIVDAGKRFVTLLLTQEQFEDYQQLRDHHIPIALNEQLGLSKQADAPYWCESPIVPDGFEKKLLTAIGAPQDTACIAKYAHSFHHRHYRTIEVDGVECFWQSFASDGIIKWAPSLKAAGLLFGPDIRQ